MITKVIFCRIGRSRSFSMERIPNFEPCKSYFRAERKELRCGLTPFLKPATARASSCSATVAMERILLGRGGVQYRWTPSLQNSKSIRPSNHVRSEEHTSELQSPMY